MLKKIFYPLLVLGGVGLIVWTGYYFRGGSDPVPPAAPAPPPQALPIGFPTVNPATSTRGLLPQQEFALVVVNPVLEFFPLSSAELLLIQPNGQVLRVTPAATEVLSAVEIPGLADAVFSSDGKFLLASFRDGDAIRHSIFDPAAKSWRPLEVDAAAPAWSPSGSRLAYFTGAGDARELVTLGAADAAARPAALARLGGEDLLLSWVAPNRIIISERASARYPSSLWSFNLGSRRVERLRENEFGMHALWDRSGTQALVFQSNTSFRGGGLTLWQEEENLFRQFSFVTLPEKCAFHSQPDTRATSTLHEFLFCAVPKNAGAFQSAQLPDAYWKRAVFANDDLFRIETATGIMNQLPLPEGTLDASRLKIQGGRLYFVNRLDNRLYGMNLP